MKDLIIAGAGGFGREAFYLAQRINAKTEQWNIKGFINDIQTPVEDYNCALPIIGTITDWHPSANEVFVVAIANPAGKEKVYNLLKSKGAQFVTLISPTAIINPTAQIGEACVITGFSSVGDNAVIGNCVHVAGSMIGQDSTVDDFSTTTGFANIASAKIGKRVFIGSHSVILNDVVVGDDAFVCAGSIVFNKVKAGTKVFGNPAKKFKI